MKKDCVLCYPADDIQVVGQNGKWRIVLVDDAAYPGFCRVIWQDHVAEMSDLPEPARLEVMDAVFLVEKAIREVMRPDKVNLASFGNMVPHLHWHIIPRFADDAHFPESVWGTRQRDPDVAILEKRRAQLPELKASIRRMLASLSNAL